MKIILYILTLSMVIVSCRKVEPDEPSNNCTKLTSIDSWPQIDFKSNYTIQIPEDFEGPGMVGFEGNIFNKNSKDEKISLNYAYCTALWCIDFGDTLQSPVPETIKIIGGYDMPVNLNMRIQFCKDSDIKGILYFNDEDIASGRLYWMEDNLFRQALELNFHITELETVVKIMTTIKERSRQ